jgi:hypothetical protein
MKKEMGRACRVRIERWSRQLLTLSVSDLHHADEHKAKNHKNNPERSRIGTHFTEFSAKVLYLESGVVREKCHESTDDNEDGGEDHRGGGIS